MRGAGDCTPTPGTLYSRLGRGGPLAPSSSWAPIPHKGMLWAPPPALHCHNPLLPKFNSVFQSGRGGAGPHGPDSEEGPPVHLLATVPSQGTQAPACPSEGRVPGSQHPVPTLSCLSHLPAGCRAHGMCARGKQGGWGQGGNPGSPAPLSWLPSAERLRVAVVTLARNCHLFCFETVVQLCELFQGRGEGRGARPKPPSVVAETGPRCPHLR